MTDDILELQNGYFPCKCLTVSLCLYVCVCEQLWFRTVVFWSQKAHSFSFLSIDDNIQSVSTSGLQSWKNSQHILFFSSIARCIIHCTIGSIQHPFYVIKTKIGKGLFGSLRKHIIKKQPIVYLHFLKLCTGSQGTAHTVCVWGCGQSAVWEESKWCLRVALLASSVEAIMTYLLSSGLHGTGGVELCSPTWAAGILVWLQGPKSRMLVF